jgi:hypothetical protein
LTITATEQIGVVNPATVTAGSTTRATDAPGIVSPVGITEGSILSATEAAAALALVGGTWGSVLSGTETTHENVTSFTCGSQSAAGTTQGTATTIIYDMVEITNSTGTNGVIIPSGCYRVAIANHSGVNNLKVYPPSGENISGQGANLARNQGSGATDLYVRQPNGQWGFLQFS